MKSLADAKHVSYWLDDDSRPEPTSALTETSSTDLAVIGAGFTVLWSALLAKANDPSLDVILLEATETGNGASGRNGGFVERYLTHTFENRLERWPDELATLIKMGFENLDAIERTVTRYEIDCNFQRTGEMVVATEPYQVEALQKEPEKAAPYGLRIQ